MKNTVFMNIIRQAARIFGTLLVIFCLVFFIGSIIEGLQRPGPVLENYNIIVFAVWGIGLAALIQSWWKEGLGAIISFISFIVFNLLAAVNPVEGSRYMFILLIFLIPSILYMLYWFLKRNMLKKESQEIEIQ